MTENESPTAITQAIADEVRERSAEVSHNVAIYDVRLTSIEAKLQEMGEEIPPLLRVRHGHGVVRNDEEDDLCVSAQFVLDMAHDTDESRLNPPITLSAVFSLSYRVTDLRSFDDAHVDAFAEVNGVFNAWPFWRELVHSTLGRMGVPSITMPNYRQAPEESDADSD